MPPHASGEQQIMRSEEVAKKGQPVGKVYPHFARADCYAQPIVQSATSSSNSRPWLLSPSINRSI